MSFRENLQNLREMKGVNQEELAERLGVSRQTISKWETGEAYPEMDKFIKMCAFFNVDMDTLLKGKVSAHVHHDRHEYERVMNRFSKSIASAVGIIIFGVAITTALVTPDGGGDARNIISSMFVLAGVLFAVPIFIYQGIRYSDFKRRHPKLPELYSEQEVTKFHRKFALLISGGVSLILAGVIFLALIHGLKIVPDTTTWPAAIFLVLIGLAVQMFIYGGIQEHKYNITSYNREAAQEVSPEQRKTGKISGVIMLTATMIFLALGLLFGMWNPAWAVFPLGGILCAIVGTVFEN